MGEENKGEEIHQIRNRRRVREGRRLRSRSSEPDWLGMSHTAHIIKMDKGELILTCPSLFWETCGDALHEKDCVSNL